MLDRRTFDRSTIDAVAGWRLSPGAYRRVALFAVVALAFIIVSGAAVRLSGSGLGCSDWPTCSNGHLVAPWQYHAWVEFGNRLVTGLVSVAIVLAVLGSRLRSPRRRDLDRLSGGLVAGLVAEIVLGGETVKHHLAPQFVTAHFLLSFVLLSDAVVLYHRAGRPDDVARSLLSDSSRRRRRGRVGAVSGKAMVSSGHMKLARLMLPAAAVVLFLGTVVTSTGPHGGDPKAKRYGFSLHDVAKIHAGSVWLFVLLAVVAIWSMVRSGVAPLIVRRAELLLGVLVAQGAIGYIQYFSGLPAVVVEIHVLGAATVWIATLWFVMSLHSYEPLGPHQTEQAHSDRAEVAAGSRAEVAAGSRAEVATGSRAGSQGSR